MAEDIVDLDSSTGDLNVTYIIGGVRFKCFPSDELDLIHNECDVIAGGSDKRQTLQGIPFWSVLQRRLASVHKVTASMRMSSVWYASLIQKRDGHLGFTEGSDDTAEPMAIGHSFDLSQSMK